MKMLSFALLLLLFTITSVSADAQKVLIAGTEGNRLLQWADFKGKPDDSSPYFAYTAWRTNVKFSGVRFNGDKALIDGFEMTMEFDEKKSWVKKGKETDELLKHEQGHFDVGLLYMQEVMRNFPGQQFTRNGFKEEFKRFIENIHSKYASMGKLYDEETNHSIQKDQQQKWDAFFNEQVKR